MRMRFFIVLTCLLALACAATPASADTCSFEILVKTGDIKNAGTDSRISLEVRGKTGPTLWINNLKAWGGKADYNYFERGHLDRFRGTGPCLSSHPCKLVLTSSGTGNKPGWYVSYVEVTQFHPDMTHRWDVEQWLVPPHHLSASNNHCS